MLACASDDWGGADMWKASAEEIFRRSLAVTTKEDAASLDILRGNAR